MSGPSEAGAPGVPEPVAGWREAARQRVERFDARVDTGFTVLREHKVANAVLVTASAVGDWSMIWHLTGAVRGLGSPAAARQAAQLSAALGVESLVVNQGVKRFFRRARPVLDDPLHSAVRRPTTSSFPSGHASSAAFAATLLSGWAPGKRPLWWGMAVVVSSSRIHVRLHHASDVLAGAALGLALGHAARAVLRRIDGRESLP